MTTTAWDALTPEQQRAEWAKFHARQAASQWTPPPAPQWMPPFVPAPLHLPPSPLDSARHAMARNPRPWVIVGAIAALVIVMMIAAVAARPVTVSGDLTVTDNTTAVLGGGSCYTLGGYDDIGSGTSVTVRDATGAIVGSGSLDSGRRDGLSCVFPFSVPDVEDSPYYTISISHRGETTYSAEDVASGDVHLTLGS